jgi:ATP-dependent Clp protease protease subunit
VAPAATAAAPAPRRQLASTAALAACPKGATRAAFSAASGAVRSSQRGQRAVTTMRQAGPPNLIPTVPFADSQIDIMGYLRQNRIIFIGEPITEKTCVTVVAELLAMEIVAPGEEIKIYINSPEGIPYHVNAIIDIIQQLKCPVSTVAFGMCGGVSALLLASGTKGRRFAMPHSRILIHQPMGGAMGSSYEVKIQATELSRNMRVLCKMYAGFSGKTEDEIREEIDRDNFLSPEQAKGLGIIDEVLA